MSYRGWLRSLLVLVLLGATAVIAPSLVLDIHGIFRDAHGRHLTVYRNERSEKYLLNRHYVPDNFDALLIGSSTTVNWNTSKITRFRVYNDSIDGANAAEERILVAQALRHGNYKVALLLVHPYLTVSHTINDGGMGVAATREALGSLSLFEEYNLMRKIRLGGALNGNCWNGAKEAIEPNRLPEQSALEYIYTIDPVALKEYRALIKLLRDRRIPTVFVVPPMYEPMLQANGEKLRNYYVNIGVPGPADVVIDFNAPQYLLFRQVRSNFSDGVHSTAEGAEQISSALAQSIDLLVQQGRLRP